MIIEKLYHVSYCRATFIAGQLLCANCIIISQDTFFGQHSFQHGIMLKYRDDSFMFFSKLSILIADEVAIKQSIESKGAAGKLFCCRCSNVISKHSWDSALDTAGLVMGHARMWQSSGCTRMILCRKSSNTWGKNMRRCQACSSPSLRPNWATTGNLQVCSGTPLMAC